ACRRSGIARTTLDGSETASVTSSRITLSASGATIAFRQLSINPSIVNIVTTSARNRSSTKYHSQGTASSVANNDKFDDSSGDRLPPPHPQTRTGTHPLSSARYF